MKHNIDTLFSLCYYLIIPNKVENNSDADFNI